MSMQQRMEKLNSKLMPFLADAYQLPAEIRAELVMDFDDLEERNKTLFMLLFTKFLMDKGQLTESEFTFDKFKDLFSGANETTSNLAVEFLAEALLRHCSK